MDYRRYWYVINDENDSSCDRDGHSEIFEAEDAAMARARQLARENPGRIYEVVSTDAAFVAPVGDPEKVVIKS